MTPALSAVYDELLARASTPPFRSRADELRDHFLRRTAAVSVGENGPDGRSEREERTKASWDEALTRGGLAADLAPGFEDPAERALARVVSRAHRGLFRLAIETGRTTARDLVGGASFLLLPRDDTVRAVPRASLAASLFDGRVVAASDGCALLPGIVFHPPDALPHVERVIDSGRRKGLSREEICDVLLRMQDTFSTLTRVKIAYAYNPEALAVRTPQPSPRPA